MRSIITIAFANEAKAYDGLHALQKLHGDGTITLYDVAVVERRADGELSLKMTRGNENPMQRAGIGAVIGSLAGATGGPVGIALGGAVGLFAGAMNEAARAAASTEYVDHIGKRLRSGTFAVIAEVHESATAPVDARMAALGGDVLREMRREAIEDKLEEQAEARRAQLEADRVNRASDKTERMRAYVESDFYDARAQLRSTAEVARERLDDTKLELADKVAALEAQIAKAGPEVRTHLEQRMIEIKAELGERERKLSHALDIALGALT